LESGLTQDELLKLARFTEEQIRAVQKDHQGAKTADLASPKQGCTIGRPNRAGWTSLMLWNALMAQGLV
jgi:hypothetical protein